jgi:DMSO/TMAO reductase YedYZ molybdopterin-dependent catalytic subunit
MFTLEETDPLFIQVGSKNIPKAALDLFNEYNLDIKLTSQEDDQVTPLGDFFVMGSRIPDNTLHLARNPRDYYLTIKGEVEHSTSISYEELLTQFQMLHIVTELYCLPDLNGIGKFSGPSLNDIISSTNPKHENLKVVFIAGDDYEEGWKNEFPLTKIRDHKEDFLVAVAMNGYPLAVEHGYPARLALTSEQGSLWVKWLDTILILPQDAGRGDYTSTSTFYHDTISSTIITLPKTVTFEDESIANLLTV